MLRHIRAAVVYRYALFRDCVSALLNQGGLRDVLTLELTKFKPELIGKAEAVIVEVERRDPNGWRAMQLMLQGKRAPDRLLVLGVSFADEEIHLLASRRIRDAAPARLLGLLEAWSGEADR